MLQHFAEFSPGIDTSGMRTTRISPPFPAALIDRLLHHRHIVNIRGNSYRMPEHPDLLRPRRADEDTPQGRGT